MTPEAFRKHAHEAVDWVADYLETVAERPVKSPASPGEIIQQLPESPPETPEPFQKLMEDLDEIIMPGITHWQHSGFHAYFNANTSFPSIIAEILTAGIGAQCMVWETSPAAAELEERMMDWLKQLLGLPSHWHGVIQDTGSTSNLIALLIARETASRFAINEQGFQNRRLRVYTSSESHSSIEKAAKIAGFGKENVVKIDVDDHLSMLPKALEGAIIADLKKGYTPCAVVAAMGTTGTLAFDPLDSITSICKTYALWLHVDAAYAGSALCLPELDWMKAGLEGADSFVFNPHKWLFTNFDCSAFYTHAKEDLIRTFAIMPEYLKTDSYGNVNDYRDWGIQLGRRFRALKLWFVLRTYGTAGIQARLRSHIEMTIWLETKLQQCENIELLTPRSLNLIVFRYVKPGLTDLDAYNAEALQSINETGQAYLTHTKVKGKYAIRVVVGQTNVGMKQVELLAELIMKKCYNKSFGETP